jgi:hypothetical protein
MRVNRARPLDASDPAQRFAQDLGLVAELRLVGHVLVLATAAASEVGAGCRNTLRRCLDDIFQSSTHKFPFLGGGLDSNEFSGKYQGHKNRLAIVMCQTVTAIHKLFNPNFHVESLSDAGGANLGQAQVR